mmetsp:Transcript_29568/g.65556  ORF Transcript_29568/g.65556 Transcript_29568/m.65556 type:complete len:423 (+) Transcript_29568:89-1357(+)
MSVHPSFRAMDEDYEEETMGFEPLDDDDKSPVIAKSPKSSTPTLSKQGSLSSKLSSKLGSLSSKLGSPSSKGKSQKAKVAEIQKRLETLNSQLADVRAQKAVKKPDGRVYGPKIDYSTPLPEKVFSHPKLDYLYGHLMHSPYRTPPQLVYPKTTYTVPAILQEYSRKGCHFADIPDKDKPYSPSVMKKQVLREVIYYNPGFSPVGPKAETSISRPGTTGSVKYGAFRPPSKSCKIPVKRRIGTSIMVGVSLDSAITPSDLADGVPLRRRQFQEVSKRKIPSAQSLDGSVLNPSAVAQALLRFQHDHAALAGDADGTSEQEGSTSATAVPTTESSRVATPLPALKDDAEAKATAVLKDTEGVSIQEGAEAVTVQEGEGAVLAAQEVAETVAAAQVDAEADTMAEIQEDAEAGAQEVAEALGTG